MTTKQISVRLPRLLDGNLNEVRRIRARAQSVELNIEPLSTASLMLEDGSGVAIRSFVELYNAKGSVGIFRVRRPDESFGSGERISLEHGICTLDDATVHGQGEIEGTPRSVLEEILKFQVTKARGQSLWTVGEVQAPNSMHIKIKHDGTKTLEMLSKLAQELEGYRLSFDQSVFPWKVNVLKNPDKAACEGRLSRNIRTIRKTLDDSDLCTRLRCSLLPNGYIESDTISAWGPVEMEITLNDDMPEEDVTAYCHRYLENRKNPVLSVQMDADEWYTMTGERIDRFEIGDICRLALPRYGVTIEERIVAISYTDVLGRPETVTVSLANQVRDMSIRTAEMKSDIDSLKNTATGYGNRLSTSESNITHLKEENEGFKEIDGKIVKWFSSAQIDLDATEAGANVGILATYQETFDLFSDVDSRVTSAELILHGDGTSANAGLIAKVTENAGEIMRQNTALVDLRSDTESATATIAANVAGNTALIRATADELSGEIELKADKITLNGYVTANQLKTEFSNFESGISDNLYVSALSANNFECSHMNFKGNGMSLKSVTVLTSSTSLTVNSTGGTVTGVTLNKRTDTLYYMSYE